MKRSWISSRKDTEKYFYMPGLFTFLKRGLLLRCPVCGQGHLFSGVFKMYEYCPVCDFHFEREEGYFSSAMAINLIISELAITAFAIPLAANQAIPILTILLWGAPLPILLPLLLFRHSRSLWMAMDHYLHPVNVASEQINEAEHWHGYR
jgi:uncharacterized protein (DUF983 family)